MYKYDKYMHKYTVIVKLKNTYESYDMHILKLYIYISDAFNYSLSKDINYVRNYFF